MDVDDGDDVVMGGSSSPQGRGEQDEETAGMSAQEAYAYYQPLALQAVAEGDKAGLKRKETAIVKLSQLCGKLNDAARLRQLISDVRPFLAAVSKAKGGKLFKELIDRFVELTSASADEVRRGTACLPVYG